MARDARDRNIHKSPGGMLYFKIGIPPELRRHFLSDTRKPKTKITESLGTDSWIQARALRDQRVAHWGRVFARLQAGAALSPEEIAGERQRIRSGTLQAWQAMLAAPPEPMLPEVARMIEAVRTGIAAQVEADRPSILAEVRAEARRIADEKFGPGIIAEGTPQWDEICRLVASAKAKTIEDHLFGLLRGAAPVEQPTMIPAPAAPIANGSAEPFRVALAHFIRWQRKNRKNRRKTVWDYLAKGKRFAKFVKNAPLGVITLDMAQAFLDDVAKEAGDTTVNLYHSVCRAVFEHARKERHVFFGANPFSFKRRRAVQQSKAKFTIEELNALFGSPPFVKRQTKPKKYNCASAVPWAAAIALYSGATLEEIAQLRPCDIRKEHGDGYVIEVTPEAAVSKRLKREARHRIVPLHPELVRLGLLKYIAALPSDAKRIFPGLPIGGKGKDHLGGALGKAFKRWRDAIGIKSSEDRKLDFHSFRHTFYKAMEDCGMPDNDRKRIAGHLIKGMEGIYSGPELLRVAPLLAKVNWPGLRIK
jgi:integrase